MQALVGRDAELAAIERAIAHAREGRGGVVLVTGEPGIGKTALARALSERAAAAGFTVAWGRAWEAGGAPPYWPWVEVLRALAERAGVVATLAPNVRAALARLLPELASGGSAAQEIDAASMRFVTAEAALALIAAATRAEPRRAVAIVLDDLHAADRGSLEVLSFIAPRVRALGVIVLGAYREAEARLSPEAALVLAHTARDAETLRPPRLAPEHVASLVADATASVLSPPLPGSPRAAAVRDLEASRSATAAELDGSPPVAAAASLAAEIGRTSEGNPLFVLEMLRLWRARAAAAGRGGREGEGALAPRRLPDTVVDVLEQRLALVAPPTRRLLELAAAQGRAFDVPTLALAAGLDEGAVREALAEAERVDIVAEGAHDDAEFTHVLIRDALYRGLAAEARAAAHLACAEAFERRAALDARVKALSLAHHFLEAALTLAPAYERALTHARAAAERAVELHAHAAAVALLRRALVLIDVRRGDARARAEVLLALGAAHMRAARLAEGRQACREAIAMARTLDDADLLARAALVHGLPMRWATIDRELVALIEEALAKSPSRPLRARLLARLAGALQPAAVPAEPMRLAREAIAGAEGLDDATRLEVLVDAGAALAYFAEPRERLALDRALVELANKLGDKVRLARGLVRLVLDHLEAGDAAGADRHMTAHIVLANELGLPHLVGLTPLLRASRALLAGRLEDAEAALEGVATIGASGGGPDPSLTVIALRVAIARARGASAPALEAELLARHQSFCDPWYTRALRVSLAAAQPARREEVAAELAAMSAAIDQWNGRISCVWVAEAALAIGDATVAARVYPLLMPLAERNHVWGMVSLVCEGPVTETLGRLAALAGDVTAARAHLGAALARAEQMGAALHLARIRTAIDGLAQEDAARGTERAPAASSWSLVREGETWTVAHGARFTRLKDSRGLRILAALVAEQGRDIHVFELLGQHEAHGSSDRGETLDRAAITAYRRRASDLEAELEEAESWSDGARVERLRAELDALKQEVARAAGLGGRLRKDSSHVERARVNVRRRIVDALERIAAELPELSPHLERSLKTGVVCAYRPAPDDPVSWRAPAATAREAKAR